VGKVVTATGLAWPAGTNILIYFESQVIGGPVTADAHGEFTVSFTVPNRQPGLYPVFFTDGKANFSPSFTITTAPLSQSPPSPGWYRNSGASGSSLLYQDSSGLRILWGNSYIYQHPGQDNLYWYAEVIYLNMGSQPVKHTCVGGANPSLTKEHIRGAEGIPPDGDGYVSAEETFCSRNPNFTGSIEPGGAHYSWAIFHNVPPGGEVSLEWGAGSWSGSSGWVDPWYQPYPLNTQPPVACPPELVALGTCQPTGQSGQGVIPEFYCLGGSPGKQGKECNQPPVLIRPAQPDQEQIKNATLCAVEVFLPEGEVLGKIKNTTSAGGDVIGVMDDIYTGQLNKVLIEFIPYSSCFQLIGSLMPIRQVE
jgi:hypothetical protein